MAPHENLFGGLTRKCISRQLRISDLICSAGKGCFLYSADVARAYRQLPLDPGDWPLVCFNFQGAYYTDISLPFGIRWAAAHCQSVTSLITSELNRKGAAVLSYIDNFGGVATDQATSATHFNNFRTILARVGLHEAAHKSSLPSQTMVWLGLQFDTVAMTVSLPQDKL